MPVRVRAFREDPTDPQSFAFVFHDLLLEKNSTAKALARLIPIHVTMPERWLRGERTPEDTSQNPHRIAEVLQLDDDQTRRLLAAQRYSLDKRLQASGRPPTHTDKLQDLLFPAPPPIDAPLPIHLPATITRYPLPPHPQIITGEDDLAMAAIAMLHQAAQKPPEQPIYITFYSPDTARPTHPTLPQWWQQAVQEALKNGWDILHLLPLNPNVDELVALVDSIRSYLPLPGAYTPYYLKQYGTLSVPSGLYSVPSVGTLNLFSVTQTGQVDAALYLTDPHQVNLLREHVEYLLDRRTGLASPLALRYSGQPESGEPIYDAVLEADQNVGKTTAGRFLFDRGLSPITRPTSFYDRSNRDAARFLPQRSFPPALREKRMMWWHQMQANFEQFVPEKRYRDVCPMSTIEKLVADCQYGVESEDLVGDDTVIATPQQIHDHLTNIKRLLDTYRNYELALLDNDEEERYLSAETTFWEVYPDQLALLEYWFPPDRDPRLPRWLDVLMREPTIVKAFSLYAEKIWNQIHLIHRTKAFVILWLDGQLRDLKDRYPEELKQRD